MPLNNAGMKVLVRGVLGMVLLLLAVSTEPQKQCEKGEDRQLLQNNNETGQILHSKNNS